MERQTERERWENTCLQSGTAGVIKSTGVQHCHRGPPFQVELITLQMYNSMFVRVLLPPGEKARIFHSLSCISFHLRFCKVSTDCQW